MTPVEEVAGPARLRAFADALAGEFRKDPEVSQVFHKIDTAWLLERGLYLVPPAALRAGVAAARQEREALEGLRGARSLADLNDFLARRIETDLARGTAGLANPDGTGGADQGTRALADLLRAERRFLEDPAAAVAALRASPPLLTLAGMGQEVAAQGYLATHDGATLFILISPRSDDDSLPSLRRFVRAMRTRAEAVRAGTAGSANASARWAGFRVAFTGEPATTVEEMDTVRRDTWLTSCVSALGVTLLTILVFRWKTHALLLLAALAIGVAWSFGAVRLELGYLNLITSSFISTLVGVGIAYGVHPISEYELQGAHTVDPIAALRGAYHATGAAVTVGAVTTAAAFFAIMLMEFRGFAELGLVAGVGVLLCLVASLVTLPALLAIHGRRRHARDRGARAGSPTAAVDRIWHERGAGLVCRFPRTVTAVALALTAGLAWAARDLKFDTNILDLLPRNAESLRYQRRMVNDSDLSPAFNIVLADDLEALRTLRARSALEPTIAKFDSVLQFLPEDAGASRLALADLRALLDTVRLPERTAPAGAERFAASLRRLGEALAKAGEAAFGAGLGGVAAPLEEARLEAEAALAVVQKAPPGREVLWDEGQDGLLDWARGALHDLKVAAAAEPAAKETLPAEIRERFVTGNGRLLAFLHPARSVFDAAFLPEFVAASRRVSRGAAGFPMVFLSMSRRITSGFHRAVAAGAVLVFLICLVDFRSLRDTGLAFLPLAMGMIWMVGGMRLLGLNFTFANIIAVPLIIGVGIDNGVHVVHRMRLEGDRGMTIVLRHTGRAILIAGLTTMIGFGSLALASHRGLAGLGLVLLVGVGACITTATLVLPNLLIAFGVARR